MPASSSAASSWTTLIRHLQASSKLVNRFSEWVMLPPRLFKRLRDNAELDDGYAARTRLDPGWSVGGRQGRSLPEKRSPETAPPVAIRPCWLKERDSNSRWRQHCWNDCVVEFLGLHKLTQVETRKSLGSRDCRYALDYCRGDKNDQNIYDRGMMNGPDDSGERYSKDREERRKRAEEFADAQLTDEGLGDLVRDLLETPTRDSPLTTKWGLGTLFGKGTPRLAFGLCILATAVVLVSVTLPLGRKGRDFAVSMQRDDLRSVSPDAPAFLKMLPQQIEVLFKPDREIISLRTPNAQQIKLVSTLTNNPTPGGTLWTGHVSLSAAAQGGEVISGAGQAQVRIRSSVRLADIVASDLEWVSLKLVLTNKTSNEAGTLSFNFGSP